MVIILKYVLLGILIYSIGIPVLDELSTIIVQGLEIIKGKLLLIATKLQTEVKEASDTTTSSVTNVIGFAIPSEEEYEEDDEEDDE